MLPAAVGFAAVLLLLLYSACLVETVDDEAILGLLTILPTYCPLWRYILSLAVHTMAIYLLCLRLLQALLGLVRRGIGVDEAQIQDLASNLADQLEAYRALSDQIDKALARRPAPPRAAAAPPRAAAAPQPRSAPSTLTPVYRPTGGLPQDHRRRGARGAGTAAACTELQPARHVSWVQTHPCIHIYISWRRWRASWQPT